jgi:uncharacterized protein YecT (DUF1311 family)
MRLRRRGIEEWRLKVVTPAICALATQMTGVAQCIEDGESECEGIEVDMNTKHNGSWAVARCVTMIVMGVFLNGQSFGQQSPEKPKKVLTPEQMAYRRQSHAYQAKRLSLQAEAKQVFEAETAREKAGDCREANSIYEFNICYGKELAITEQNLKSYEGIIHGLMTPGPQMPGLASTNQPGVAGPTLTPEQLSEEFDSVEKSWRAYREAACTAGFHQFDGGTGGPSFEEECELKLTRDHMRELDMIYGGDLHP